MPLSAGGLAKLSKDSCAGKDSAFSILGLFGVFGGASATILMVGIVLLVISALVSAGFLAGRELGQGAMVRRAAAGALTGPAWAASMLALSLLVTKSPIGAPIVPSLLVCFLFGGIVLGACGGLCSYLPRTSGGTSRN
jgi:hypothetical protein